MDINSFLAYIKVEYIDVVIAKHIEKIFNTSNDQLDRLLHKWKYKKLIGSIKYELGRKLMVEFNGKFTEWWSSKIKNAKNRKVCVKKQKLKFEDYKK